MKGTLRHDGFRWGPQYLHPQTRQPIERTPQTHPYNYDSYIMWESSEEEGSSGCYSDRLLQWDYDKHNRLCRKHFGNEGQYWDQRDTSKIEAFLQDWHEEPNLRLVRIIQCCNQSSGYPVWYFSWVIDVPD